MSKLTAFLTGLASAGPASMLLVTIADTAFLPTSQLVDLLILTQASRIPEAWWQLGLFAVIGSTIGALILYAIARGGGGWALRKSVKPERLERIQTKIRKYDVLALVLPTAVPLPLAPMKVFVVMAGALGVRPVRFAVTVALARAVRYFSLILLGVYFGEEVWNALKGRMWMFGLGGLAIFLLFLAWSRARARREAEAEEPATL